MKKYFAVASFLLSMKSFAQVTTPHTMQLADDWFRTPAQAIEFLRAVRPDDANDVKEFLQNSKVDMSKNFPTFRMEGNKIYLGSMTEPIIWNLDGTFSFKNLLYRYDRNLSFKQNLQKFDQRWGTLKEFGNWKRQSRFEAFALSQAYADESDSGIRSWFLKLDVLSILGVQGSESSVEKADKEARRNAQDNANFISCGEKPLLRQKSVNIQMNGISDSTVSYSAYSRNPKNLFKLKGKIDLNDLKMTKEVQKSNSGNETYRNLEKESASMPASMPTEYHRMTLAQSLRTLIEVCQAKSEAKYNQEALRVAEYIEFHKLSDRLNEKFGMKSKVENSPTGSAPSVKEGAR